MPWQWSQGQLTFQGMMWPATSDVREVIIALHGYGRPPRDFERFTRLLKPDQSLLSLGLFGHGTSELPQRMHRHAAIDPAEHAAWFAALLDVLKAPRVSLLAYSMGGRIALTLVEHLPDRIQRLMLIAPDGFTRLRLYDPLFGTRAGRALYWWTERYPGWVFGLVRLLTWARLVSPKLEQFVLVHFREREKRQRLRETWVRYRAFHTDLDQFAALINSGEVNAILIFGRYDSVIPVKLGQAFQRRVTPPVFHTVESGHLILTEQLIDYIVDQDLWFP